MNEEEKQAIEYWKTHIEILHCNTQIASEHYMRILLDLIEKQQKEIENLKFKYQARKDRTKVIIEKQQKEIEEKEKVIDEMAKKLVDLQIPISQEENILFLNYVKKFFYKKIEKK